MTHANHLFNLLKFLGLLEAPVLSTVDNARAAKSLALALGNSDLVIGKYQVNPLTSVMQNLGHKNVVTPHYFSPGILNLQRGQFPKEKKPDATTLQQHLDKFKASLLKVAGDGDKTWLTIEQYGTTLAIHANYSDISVTDALRIATAYSVCLENNADKTDFRLLGASVSGIQTYLYDLISKNAAKLLKGRSFYIQLLTDSLVQKMVADLQLSPLNVIYASGGGCYLLAPNNAETLSRFEKFAEEATKMLYKEHKAMLFVDIAKSSSFDENVDLLDRVWEDLLLSLNKVRFRRLNRNKELAANFLGFTEYGGTKEKDPITNIEFEDTDIPVLLADGVTQVHPRTKEQIDMGKILRETKIIASSLTTDGLPKADKIFSDPFGCKHYFYTEHSNGLNFPSATARTLNLPDGPLPTMLYGSNQFPFFEKDTIYNGDYYRAFDPKPYDYLAEGKDFDRLGVLRMDVDNLGIIFSDQISESSYPQNFSRYAAVSRNLDWFFKGYLNTYQKEKYSDSTVIVYSGGDDLFIVGRWNEVLNFGIDIRQEFKDWASGNSKLTISGGIAVVTGKYPLMQAAEDAKNAEKEAKRYPAGKKDKNAFCLMGKALGWETEMQIVQELKADIFEFLRTKQLKSAFLTKASAHAIARDLQVSGKKTQRWLWTMAWDFTRFRDSNSASTPKAKEFVERVMKDAFSNSYKGKKLTGHNHYMDLLLVAVRWAELERRTFGIEGTA